MNLHDLKLPQTDLILEYCRLRYTGLLWEEREGEFFYQYDGNYRGSWAALREEDIQTDHVRELAQMWDERGRPQNWPAAHTNWSSRDSWT